MQNTKHAERTACPLPFIGVHAVTLSELLPGKRNSRKRAELAARIIAEYAARDKQQAADLSTAIEAEEGVYFGENKSISFDEIGLSKHAALLAEYVEPRLLHAYTVLLKDWNNVPRWNLEIAACAKERDAESLFGMLDEWNSFEPHGDFQEKTRREMLDIIRYCLKICICGGGAKNDRG